MENLKHRTGAKIVAIVNLVLSCITLIALGILVVFYLIVLGAAGEHHGQDHEDVKFFAVIGGVGLLILICMEILELVSAHKLLQSTRPGTNFAEAANLARFWRNVALILVVISIFGALTGGRRSRGMSVTGLLYLVLRIFGLFVVHNYIKELEQAVNLQMPHVVYAVPGDGEQGHGFVPPPGHVMVMMPQQSHQQAGFVYPNLSQAQAGFPYSDPCPKYADVVDKR